MLGLAAALFLASPAQAQSDQMTSLDAKSPDFGYHDVGTVASSNGTEDQDAIQPAFLLANGHL